MTTEAAGTAGTGERVPGLSETLPPGERLLWQGAPDWRSLAVRAFHVRKVAAYFAIGIALQWALAFGDPEMEGASLARQFLPLVAALLGLGLLLLLARLSARTTLYVITSRRVFLRIGIALPIFVNLPFSGIDGAALRLHPDGTGDVPLQLQRGARLAWLHLWPHARPWQLRRPEPCLRCVPDAARVAKLLSEALAATTGGTATAWNGVPSAAGAGVAIATASSAARA